MQKYCVFVMLFILPFFLINASFANNERNKGVAVTVTGIFEVGLTPQTDDEILAGRMLINKTYSGGLKAMGLGQMLSKRTSAGTAAYFAIEEVSGVIDGKAGSFTLIHKGFMSKDEQSLDVNILPGSGAGELETISGSMSIVKDGKIHRYELTYQL